MHMKRYLVVLVSLVLPLVMLFSTGSTAFAQTAPTPNQTYSGGSIVSVACQNGPIDGSGNQACGFAEFMALLNRIISFLIFIIAPIIMTGVLLYGGVLILTSGGSTEQVGKAKSMMIKAITGMAIAMAGWIIVKFVMVQLGYNSSSFPTFY